MPERSRRQFAAACRATRGFTLIEVLVAVGAVVLLTLGIGQIFRQVSKLVGTGASVAEVDQLARAVEAQLRDDFAGLSRMPASESYFAIRGRRLGDFNRNRTMDGVSQGERTVYLTPDDADIELRAAVADPYAQGGRGRTVRIDELSFLAQGEYRSAQPGGPANDTARQAINARIYYGHGLRPTSPGDPSNNQNPNGETFDPAKPAGRDPQTNAFNYPHRQWRPDGATIAGNGAAQLQAWWGDYFSPDSVSTGVNRATRNQYAGRYVLLRQAMLLSGGKAFKTAESDRRTVVPLLRDAENYLRGARFSGPSGDPIEDRLWGGPADAGLGFALPRSIRQGRTDICAQSADDVRRWFEGLEGENPNADVPTADVADATAYDTGEYNLSALATNPRPDQDIENQSSGERPLWVRAVRKTQADATNPPAGEVRLFNLRGVQTAIAGTFTRMLADNEPPVVVRQQRPNDPDPAQTFMDVHAALAERCSSFEVSWSDGTVWRGFNGNGNASLRINLDDSTTNGYEIEYKIGDMIWFDIDFPRRALTAIGGQFYRPTGLDPEILPEGLQVHEATGATWISPNNERSPGNSSSRINVLNGVPQAISTEVVYDAASSGGDDREYLGIWGFRVPNDVGGYGGAWGKPRFVRVRMTLHDSAFRIPDGKRYEFVFTINQSQ